MVLEDPSILSRREVSCPLGYHIGALPDEPGMESSTPWSFLVSTVLPTKPGFVRCIAKQRNKTVLLCMHATGRECIFMDVPKHKAVVSSVFLQVLKSTLNPETP